jgi:oligoribonuclease NrnB/cAMP/cGMP phosphodiesterase (DHH superfamily)
MKQQIPDYSLIFSDGKGNELPMPRSILKGLTDLAEAIEDSTQKRIVERNGQFCVVSETINRSFGCYPTKGEAEDRLAQIEHFAKEITPKQDEPSELDKTFKQYHAMVNMGYSELKSWSENSCSKEASLTRGPINRNLRLLSRKKEEWTEADIRDAKKTIAFISRMQQVADGDPVSEDCPYSKRTIALRNWAFDPVRLKKAKEVLKSVADLNMEFAFEKDPNQPVFLVGQDVEFASTQKKADPEERFVLGIVLEPLINDDGSPIIEDGNPVQPDKQGHVYGPSTIRKTAYEWLRAFRAYDYQHKVMLGSHEVEPVSSDVTHFPGDLVLADGTVRHIRKTTWLVGSHIVNDELWGQIKRGEITGYSMNGFSHQEPVQKAIANSQEPILCFYHKDQDGVLSAAIVSKFEGNENCKFVGINYGEAFPWETVSGRKRVYMVDFSLQPFDEMECLAEICNAAGADLVWIEHHKEALIEGIKSGLCELVRGAYDSQEAISKEPVSVKKRLAGCDLAWKYFSRDPAPPIVNLVGRWDVWDHQDPLVRPIAFALDGNNFQIEMFEDLLSWSLQKIKDAYLERGEAILEWYSDQNSKRIQQLSFPVEFEALKFIAANTDTKGSIQFEQIEGYDAGLAFKWKPGSGWEVALYALKEEADVGAICKKHGGGGHRGAGGFVCQQLPFELP